MRDLSSNGDNLTTDLIASKSPSLTSSTHLCGWFQSLRSTHLLQQSLDRVRSQSPCPSVMYLFCRWLLTFFAMYSSDVLAIRAKSAGLGFQGIPSRTADTTYNGVPIWDPVDPPVRDPQTPPDPGRPTAFYAVFIIFNPMIPQLHNILDTPTT